jgi:glycosyltransferase involved in cell wall biosynthesis
LCSSNRRSGVPNRAMPQDTPGNVPGVIAIGPLPPWITGQSIATEAVVSRFCRDLPQVRMIDTAPRNRRGRWRQRLSRLPRYAAALAALLGRQAADWAYLVVDADSGMYFNILCAAVARRRGMRLVLHHHNYSYIARATTRMRALAWAAGVDAVHVTLCAAMSRELTHRYPGVRRTAELSNAHILGARGRPKAERPPRFTIGHLSNLCVEKGLGVVIDLVRVLRQAGIDAHLRLAGPAADESVSRIIADVQAEMPGHVTYDGPLYGERKDAFYKDISVFAFPSAYRNEAESIVILEALAAGTPVVAYGQCCIPNLIGDHGGLMVPAREAFAPVSLPLLICWATRAASLEEASVAARHQFDRLLEASEAQLAGLLQLVGTSASSGCEGVQFG